MSTANRSLLAWLDNDRYRDPDGTSRSPYGGKIDWIRIIPFIGLHAACISVFVVGWSPAAIAFAIASYLIRMFAITGFYHRYFAHRSFKTGRATQFLFALLGATATQRGPIWWAAHHRHHHATADTESDCHSPRRGFWWSHVGWFLTRDNFATRRNRVADLMRYPELRWLDRYDAVPPLVYALLLYLTGEWLAVRFPGLATDGMQLVVWGYFVSTVVLLHITLLINSMAHKYGSRRFDTADDSRNSMLLALLTLGEGWHNNHHYYPVSARQGFYWWEIDITFYVLKFMSILGLIWDVKGVPRQKMRQDLLQAGGRA